MMEGGTDLRAGRAERVRRVLVCVMTVVLIDGLDVHDAARSAAEAEQ